MSLRACIGSLLSVLMVALFAFWTGGGEPAIGVETSIPSIGSRAPALDAGARSAGATEDWLGRVMTQIEREEYNASGNEHGLQAPNRAHNLRTYFVTGGIQVVPRTGGAVGAWSLSWRTLGWGREGHLVEVAGASVKPRANGSRVTYAHDGLEEWYENKEEGLEQGFTVMERPAGDGPLCVEGCVGSGLRAELGSDKAGIDFLDAGNARVLRYAELHVRDAGGRAVPSYLRLEDNRVAILIDDADAGYPLTIDPLVTSPSWTAESNQAGALFGVSVGTAGDVNGDGYSDVIVGAVNYDNGQIDEGRAFVYHGSAAGLAVSPGWTAESNQAGADFGISVGTAGDVNGDGYSDVIVGALYYDNGQADEGRVFLYHGSAGGLAASAAWTAESNQAGAYFGLSVGTAGDVNGDGYSDVIVGAPIYDNGQEYEGRAFVYHGSAGGLALSAGWIAESNQVGAELGYSVGTAGDVNGDGYSDVVVGAPAYSNGQEYEGRAFVYHGSAGGLAASETWTAESNQAGAYFGVSVGTAGDVNGDGYSDVIVGAVNYDNGQEDEGRAYVYHGSAGGLDAIPGWTAEGDQANALFGLSVGTAGDVNGDGYSDVIVGAFGYNGGDISEGRAFVYYGNEGDGLHRIPRQARTDNSAPIALLGLSKSDDGFLLKAAGRTPAGRGNVRLQYEVKPMGTPFNGTGLVTSPVYDTGIPAGGGSVADLSELVSGLTSNTLYHWRLRTVSDSPLFPRSPWFSLPYNCVTEADVRTGNSLVGIESDGDVPSARLFGSAAPNPFGTSTQLTYTLPGRGRVRLAVYNVAGQQVAVLRDGEEIAGPHMVNWDGKGARGSRLPSGVYFVQLNFRDRKEVRKIVLTR